MSVWPRECACLKRCGRGRARAAEPWASESWTLHLILASQAGCQGSGACHTHDPHGHSHWLSHRARGACLHPAHSDCAHAAPAAGRAWRGFWFGHDGLARRCANHECAPERHDLSRGHALCLKFPDRRDHVSQGPAGRQAILRERNGQAGVHRACGSRSFHSFASVNSGTSEGPSRTRNDEACGCRTCCSSPESNDSSCQHSSSRNACVYHSCAQARGKHPHAGGPFERASGAHHSPGAASSSCASEALRREGFSAFPFAREADSVKVAP